MGTAARGGLLLLGCSGLEAVASKLEHDTNHTVLFIYRSHPGHTPPSRGASCGIRSFLIHKERFSISYSGFLINPT